MNKQLSYLFVDEIENNPSKINELLSIVVDIFLQAKIDEQKWIIDALDQKINSNRSYFKLSYYSDVIKSIRLIQSNDFMLAIENLQASFNEAIANQNKTVEAIIYCFKGICYRSIGQSTYALSHHLKSKEIIDFNNLFSNVQLMNNHQIGELYAENGEIEKAIKLLSSCIKSPLNFDGIESVKFRSHSTLSIIYSGQGNFNLAKTHLNCQESLSKTNLTNESRFYSDLALYHFRKKEYTESIEFEEKSLSIRIKQNRTDPMATCYISIGKSKLALNETDQALEYLTKALNLCLVNKTNNKVLICYKIIADIHKKAGHCKEAIIYLDKYVALSAEINLDQNKSREVINEKLLKSQKEVFEETMRELSSSVRYAERIQRAMLQSVENLNNFLPLSFIYLRPHSVISGDFYWFTSIGDKVIIACGDCTGHGVPAGMLTIKGHGLLTRIVTELKITEPDLILKLLAEKLHYDLDFKNSKIEDGMDISICTIDKSKNKILFSGAKRPLVIIEDGVASHIRGDRMSIGGNLPTKAFTRHEIEYSKSANYFMFTDGYIDQFGGKNDKKFKIQKFIELLENSYGKGAEFHLENIENTFMNWRGLNERKLTPQTDDVLVIGFSA